jgi:hypothetical protein
MVIAFALLGILILLMIATIFVDLGHWLAKKLIYLIEDKDD